MDQLKNTASLPFVFKHIAAMPDVHYGFGCTVGSVIALKDHVLPSAVGVGIGCGMMTIRLNENADIILNKAKDIRHSIERSVPVGHRGNARLTASVEAWQGWGRG